MPSAGRKQRCLRARRQGGSEQSGSGRAQRLDEHVEGHDPDADERGGADESAPNLTHQIHRVGRDRRARRHFEQHHDRGDRSEVGSGTERSYGCGGARPGGEPVRMPACAC